MSDTDSLKIQLALSGGGLRATLFHLGVLWFLKQTDQLKRVSQIYSVSGGSIAAGHVLQHWDAYANGDVDQFKAAAKDLIDGSARYGIREHVKYNFVAPQLRFGQLLHCYIDGLARDKRDVKLRDVIKTPDFHILGTDFSIGRLVSFSRKGISLFAVDPDGQLREERAAMNARDAEFGLWEAVACSSAFPPMFAPHLISPVDYAAKDGRNIIVGDGGVYDNLGINLVEYLSRKQTDEKTIYLISDAGLPFRNGLVSGSSYKGMLDRVTRASDIQFYRLADSDMRRFGASLNDNSARKLVNVRIGDTVHGSTGDSVLDVKVQDLVASIRTDLDTFCDEEIQGIVQHGWEAARDALQQQAPELQINVTAEFAWSPAGRVVTQDQMEKRLKSSSGRKFYWGPLFSFWDFAAAFIVGLPFFSILIFGVIWFSGNQLISIGRYKALADIESGQIGILASWGYHLDKDEAIVTVQSSKKPEVVGSSYVILVMRVPTDGTPSNEETRTVVSKVHKFQGIGGTIIADRIPCSRLSGSIHYGDNVNFYLYKIPHDRILKIQVAIEKQSSQPLTIDRIKEEFNGVKLGAGMDTAVFDEHGDLIKCASSALEKSRKSPTENDAQRQRILDAYIVELGNRAEKVGRRVIQVATDPNTPKEEQVGVLRWKGEHIEVTNRGHLSIRAGQYDVFNGKLRELKDLLSSPEIASVSVTRQENMVKVFFAPLDEDLVTDIKNYIPELVHGLSFFEK